MRIGLFSDTYHPTINGITFVVETMKKQLEAHGHEVYVFCPARTMRPSKQPEFAVEGNSIIRIPSFPSGFFDDFDFALFFPPRVLKKISELQLDIIHIFTPSQIGLLGINAAVKQDIPFVVQHCTDMYEYVEHYPQVLPGVLALAGIVFPASMKLSRHDYIEIVKLHRPYLSATTWGKHVIEMALTLLYSKADAVIALSRKSRQQLLSWQDDDYNYDVTMMPNGVDAIPKPQQSDLDSFREQWGLRVSDEVFGFVGRLAAEKNLSILIKAFDKIGRDRPRAKLVFIGDFDFRETLEDLAATSRYPDRIIFTGFINRQQLGVAYAALDVFVFPSLKDTQGWVLHEAAHAGLPIVMLDRDLSEVMVDGENGFFAKNNATDIARKITELLRSPALRKKFGIRSQQLARQFTERRQIVKLIRLYETIVAGHDSQPQKTKKPDIRRFRQRVRWGINQLRRHDSS